MSFTVFFLCGICIGFMGAFLGIGGGIIIVPLLTIVFHIPIHEAVATSLVVVVANSIASSGRYITTGIANMRLGLFLSLFSVTGSVIGSHISMNISSKALYLTLGIAQIITVIFMLFNKKLITPGATEVKMTENHLTAEYYDKSTCSTVRYTPVKTLPIAGLTAISGMLAGLVGVGGGVFVVPTMNIVGKIPIKAATSTSGFMMGFTAAAGGILFFLSGYTNPRIACEMIPGIFLATAIGTRLFSKVKSEKIYKIFILFLAVIAVQMIYKGLANQ